MASIAIRIIGLLKIERGVRTMNYAPVQKFPLIDNTLHGRPFVAGRLFDFRVTPGFHKLIGCSRVSAASLNFKGGAKKTAPRCGDNRDRTWAIIYA